MKLLKCHIENFGKLSGFDYTFKNGLNIFNEENGWGKSTFATFIKSMFYGLASTTKRNLDENERKKYKPWQGGNYGGNIDFDLNGKSYRITRFFGKNSSEDIFEFTDLSTGKKSKDFSENIGEEIFGLDEEAFERSAFLPQKALNSLVSENISNKLTNLIHGTDEQFNIEKTLQLLDRKRVSLTNNKKTGQIQILENEIDELLVQINSLKNSSQAIIQLQSQVEEEDEKIQGLLKKQRSIKEKMTDIAIVKEKIANKDLYKTYCDKIEELEREKAFNEEILNEQVCGVEEINDFIHIQNEISKKQAKIDSLQEGYVAERYSELTDYFGDEENIPDSQQIKDISDKIYRLNALKLKGELSVEQGKKPDNEKGGNKKSFIPFILLGLTILFLVAGFVTLKMIEILPIVMFVLGGLSLAMAGFVYLKNQINGKDNSSQKLELENNRQNQIEINEIENQIRDFVCKYETGVSDVVAAFASFQANYNEFEKIKNQYQNNLSEINDYNKEIERQSQTLQNFLMKFNFKEGFNKDNLAKLEMLKQAVITISNLKEKISKEREGLERFIKDKHFDVKEENVEDIDINSLQKDDEALQGQIDVCKESKAQLLAKINKINDDISEIDELERRREELLERIKQYSIELTAIKNAKKFLENANDSLSSRLLAPMKEGLKKYLKKMTEIDFNNILLDTDFNITFEEFGQAREVDFYSKGYKDVIDICMRFALIEALFEKEKPFIVVDDAFVNLDENKIENAKKFLKEISKEFQIIYFVCHTSRA